MGLRDSGFRVKGLKGLVARASGLGLGFRALGLGVLGLMALESLGFRIFAHLAEPARRKPWGTTEQ